MNCSTPGLPVHHQPPEFTQNHVHWVGDAIRISSSVIPFSSCPQSFPASGSFPMSLFFPSGGQSIGVSAPASVLPMDIQGWFPLGLTGLISLLPKRLSRVFYSTTVRKHQFFGAQPSFWRIGFLSLADKVVKINWGHWLASSLLVFWQPHGLRGRVWGQSMAGKSSECGLRLSSKTIPSFCLPWPSGGWLSLLKLLELVF